MHAARPFNFPHDPSVFLIDQDAPPLVIVRGRCVDLHAFPGRIQILEQTMMPDIYCVVIKRRLASCDTDQRVAISSDACCFRFLPNDLLRPFR